MANEINNEIKGAGKNELSTDIATITAEINAYQRVAGEAIFEIGRRLKHVKENDLVYGEWAEWLSEVGLSERQTSRFIRVYDRFPNSPPVANLGLTASVLDALTSFDDEELEEPREMPDGSTKKLTEMSRREIEGFKQREKEAEEKANKSQRAADEAERRLTNSEKENSDLKTELQRAITPDVEIKEVVKEVVPADVKRKMDEIEKERDELDAALSKTYSELRDLRKLEKSVQHHAQSPLYDMYRSLSAVEGYLQVFTEDERMAGDLVANADKEVVERVDAVLRRVISHAQHARGIVDGEEVTIVNVQ